MGFRQLFTVSLIFFAAPLGSWAKISVCATTSLVGDLVKKVAKDDAEVHVLMGPGVDPHLYKATASDVKLLTRCDIVFYNGLHLEGRMGEVFESLSKRGKPVYAISDLIDSDDLIDVVPGSRQYDPHIWFNPDLWADCLDTITAALVEKDPFHAQRYMVNAMEARKQLNDLAIWGVENVELLPKDKRILITSHDAYNYFGRAFDFQVIGIQGISTATEAGLADIVSMADYIKDKEIKAIFIESSVSPAAIERVSSESGARVGGELFSDALGTQGDMRTVAGQSLDVGTYEGMFKYNLLTIVEALK